MISRRDKLLDAMRANPSGDWTMDDVASLCRAFDVTCSAPRRGSHFKLSHPSTPTILTIPHRRPIKAPYVRALVKLVDSVIQATT